LLAIVARRQAKDNTKILQRAYLNVRAAGIHMSSDRDDAVAHVDILNGGNLPATDVKWFIRHDFCSNDNLRIDGINARLVGGPGNVIAPHAKMRQGGDPIAVGPDALRSQEGLYLYIWGAITYRDGFRRKRKTTFCHRYDCVNVAPNLQRGALAMSGVTARDH